jgi:hypothetical protein
MKYNDKCSFCSFSDYKARRLPLKNWITKPFWLRLRTNQSLAIVERQPIGVSPPERMVHPQNARFQNVRFQNVRFQNVMFTKRPVYKTSGFKTSGFKTFGFKTSIEMKASICPVFKFDILTKQKVLELPSLHSFLK